MSAHPTCKVVFVSILLDSTLFPACPCCWSIWGEGGGGINGRDLFFKHRVRLCSEFVGTKQGATDNGASRTWTRLSCFLGRETSAAAAGHVRGMHLGGPAICLSCSSTDFLLSLFVFLGAVNNAASSFKQTDTDSVAAVLFNFCVLQSCQKSQSCVSELH